MGVLGGVVIAAPGLLWFLQGTAIIQIPPILCVTNCEPVVGGSPSWEAAGVVTFVVGVGIAFFSAELSRIETGLG